MKISKNVFCFDSILLQMYMYVSSKGGGVLCWFFFLNFVCFSFWKGEVQKLKLWKKFENEIDKPVEWTNK